MGKPPDYTITIDNPTPKLGDIVHFTAEGGDPWGLWFVVQAHVNDQTVYSQTGHAWVSDANPGTATPEDFMLGPTGLWPSGPAEGVCQLMSSKKGRLDKVLAELDFHIAA